MLSIPCNDWQRLTETFEPQRTAAIELAKQGRLPELPRKPVGFDLCRGFLVVIDWDQQRIMAAKELAMPMGFCVEDSRIVVANWFASGNDWLNQMMKIQGHSERGLPGEQRRGQ